MSRIGRTPISVPAGVEVKIGDDNLVTVKGPKGTLTQKLSSAMTLTQEGGELHVDGQIDSLAYEDDRRQGGGFNRDRQGGFNRGQGRPQGGFNRATNPSRPAAPAAPAAPAKEGGAQ